MGPGRWPGLSAQAGGGMAFQEARELDCGDDQSSGGDAAAFGDDLRFYRAEADEAAGIARYDAQTSLGIADGRLHRERADPGVARSFWRALGPVHALRFDAGGLRVRMQVLRE